MQGQTGLGKSTLVNTIFASHLLDSKGRTEIAEQHPIRQTTEIQAVSHGQLGPHLPSDKGVSALSVPPTVIQEDNVRLRLNIIDTPGFGDMINNDGW